MRNRPKNTADECRFRLVVGMARKSVARVNNNVSQYDTTKIVNVDDEDFTGHLNKEPYEIKKGESRILPKFVAEHLAKHLIDKVLQKKGLKDTLRDTPLRRSLFAQILPEITEVNPDVKKMDKEDELKALKETVEKQNSLITSLGGKVKELEEEVKKPKKGMPKGGWPKKEETVSPEIK